MHFMLPAARSTQQIISLCLVHIKDKVLASIEAGISELSLFVYAIYLQLPFLCQEPTSMLIPFCVNYKQFECCSKRARFLFLLCQLNDSPEKKGKQRLILPLIKIRMYGDQVSELLLGGKKSDIFLTRTLTWLKLFPLTMLH